MISQINVRNFYILIFRIRRRSNPRATVGAQRLKVKDLSNDLGHPLRGIFLRIAMELIILRSKMSKRSAHRFSFRATSINLPKEKNLLTEFALDFLAEHQGGNSSSSIETAILISRERAGSNELRLFRTSLTTYRTGTKGDELESKPRCCGDISVTASAVRMFILEVCVQNRGGIRNNTRFANAQRVIWHPP